MPRYPSWEFTTLSETLLVMLKKEQTTYSGCSDYLGSQLSSTSQAGEVGNGHKVVHEADRTMLVEWCYKVIDKFKLEREVVAMAMDLVDRFLSKFKTCDLAYKTLHDRVQFQLLTMTALNVAIKTNASTTGLGSKLFSIIDCDMYSISEIEDMELSLLNGLSWYISAPTSVQIANHILKLISKDLTVKKSTWALILDEVHSQIELAVMDYYFVTQRSSTVAMAAMFNALDLVEEDHDRRAFFTCLLKYLVSNGEKYVSIWQILDSKHRLQCLANDHGSEETPLPLFLDSCHLSDRSR